MNHDTHLRPPASFSLSTSVAWGALVALLLAFGTVPGALAQDGPGGVGNAGGTVDDGVAQPENVIWMRADDLAATLSDGDNVTLWDDASGNGRDAEQSRSDGQPIFVADALNGQPAVRFDDTGRQNLAFNTNNAALQNLPSGSNTLIVVARTTEIGTDDQYVVAITDGNNRRGILFNLPTGNPNTIKRLVAQSSNGLAGSGGKTTQTDDVSIANFNIATSRLFAGSSIEIRANGDFKAEETSNQARRTFSGNQAPRIGSVSGTNAGNNLIGDVAEVIAFDGAINEAQLRIVENYLSEKYGVSILNDYYSEGTDYPENVAGIGQAAGSDHLSAQSSILNLRSTGFSGNGQFVFTGHDGRGVEFTTGERPNGRADAIKIKREWIAQVSGSTNQSLTVRFDLNGTGLSIPSGYNDFALFIDDSDGDYTSGARHVDLTETAPGSGIWEATGVSVSTGESLTLGAVNRTIAFQSPQSSDFENTGGGNLGDTFAPPLNASLNYASASALDVDLTFAPGANSPVEDTDGTFDTGGGPNDDDDFFAPDATVSFPANQTTADLNAGSALQIYNDGDAESNTEYVDVTLSASGTPALGVGGTSTTEFGIIDDDNAREISFTSNVPSSPVSESDDGSVVTLSFEVAVPAGEDGSPSTVARFEVSGDVTPGQDFRIPGAYRISSTFGEVTIPDSPGTGDAATFEIELLDDDLYENPDEVLTVTLAGATSGTLEMSSNRQIDLTITDTDPVPTVSFVEPGASGSESESPGTLQFALDAVAGSDLDVAFSITGGSATGGGDDYTLLTTSPVTIAAGSTTGSVELSIADDNDIEFAEDVVVEILSSGTDAQLGSPVTATYTIFDNDGVGPDGPGGVGDAESLTFWLRGEDVSGSQGDEVTTWPDVSGRGNDAVQASINGSTPNLATRTLNGFALVGFNTGETLEFTSSEVIGLSSGPSTIATVAQSDNQRGQDQVIFNVNSGQNDIARSLFYEGNRTNIVAQAGKRQSPTESNTITYGANAFRVLSTAFTGSTLDMTVDRDVNSANTGETLLGDRAFLGSRRGNDGSNLVGDVAEIAGYEVALNEPQRIIVDNYLAAKYGQTLTADDLYDGDTAANGDFDRGVFGVGQSGGEVHGAARTDGLRFDALPSGLDDGDFIFAGHATPTNNFISTDVSGIGGTDVARMDRVWYVNRNENGSTFTVDVTFDFSEAGLGNDTENDVGSASDYVLVRRSNNTSGTSWTEQIIGASDVTGDRVRFANVTLTDGAYYTIATRNQAASGVVTVALTIRGTDGNEGDAPTGTLGGDAGYRFIGPPVEGMRPADIETETDPQFIEFGEPSPMFYFWDDQINNSSGPDGSFRLPIDQTEQWVNGRAGLTFFFDDVGTPDADPIDPELTLRPTAGTAVGEPSTTAGGTSAVIVGDERDTQGSLIGTGPDGQPYDAALNTNAAFHFLSNPYPYQFNLGSLVGTDGSTDLAGSGFQSNVLVWDYAGSADDFGNGTVGTYQMLSADPSGSPDDVAQWQGFFVERTAVGSGADQLAFLASGRDIGTIGTIVGSMLKAGPASPTRRIELQLVATQGSEVVGLDRAAGVTFSERASEGWDAFDLTKLTPWSSRYGALAPVGVGRDGVVVPKTIESRPMPSTPVFVDLSVTSKGLNATYRIELAETINVPSDWVIELIDTQGTPDESDDRAHRLDGSSRSVRVEAEALPVSKQSGGAGGPRVERFAETLSRAGMSVAPGEGAASKSSTSAASTSAKSTVPRYRLRIDPTGEPLPVEFGAFNGVQDGEVIRLEWQTLSETSNDGFAVEVKPDAASSYREVGYVSGAGTTTEARRYTFTVEERLGYGTHSFRLRQVDADGTPNYSKPITVEKSLDRPYDVSKTAPNPVTSTATMNVTVREEQNVRVEVFDLLGRRVAQVHDGPLNGGDTKKITLGTSGLSSGVYFIRVDGETFQEVRRMTVVR